MDVREIKYEKKYFEEILGSRSREQPDNKFRRHIKFLLQHKKKGKVLDIGFAKGHFLHEFDKIEGWKTYGIDISEYVLKIAREKTKAVLKITDLNKDNLPFKDNFFDIVYASEVIEHLKPKNNMLKEVYRCLKKDGLVFFTTPNRPRLKIVEWDKTCGHINMFDRNRMYEELKKAGFDLKKVKVKYEGLPGLGLIRRLSRNRILNDELLLDFDWPFRTNKSLIVFGFK